MNVHTVNEVAILLRLSKSKVYELVEQGKLGHHRFDGAIRISDEQIEEYLQKTKIEPREETRAFANSGIRRLRL